MMTDRPIRITPKGTVLCHVCGERTSVKGAAYVRRPGWAHRDPVCAGCKAAPDPTQRTRAPKGLVRATIPVSPFIQSAIDAHNAAVIAGEDA